MFYINVLAKKEHITKLLNFCGGSLHGISLSAFTTWKITWSTSWKENKIVTIDYLVKLLENYLLLCDSRVRNQLKQWWQMTIFLCHRIRVYPSSYYYYYYIGYWFPSNQAFVHFGVQKLLTIQGIMWILNYKNI